MSCAHRIDVAPLPAAWRKFLPRAGALARKAAVAALEDGRAKLPARARSRHRGALEISVVPTSDAAMRRLNHTYRGKNKPTNVLSFPALQPRGPRLEDEAPRMLGDIAIAYETTRREADEEQKPFGHHLSHLAVHGFLHLIGHDHEQDQEAETMESLEREILAQLGIPDPNAERMN